MTAEQRALAVLLYSVDDKDWRRPSAAAGWTLRDQVAHLADTEEVAADTLTGGPRAFADAVSPYRSAEDFTAAGCRRGDGLSAEDLIEWWDVAAAKTRALLAEHPDEDRVGWGFGMPARTFVMARLMEHWAHSLDITDALGLPVAETPRARHVAWLGLRTLRYAFGRAKVRPPAGHTLRLELTGMDGVYETGPEDATDVLRGPLIEWCRVATRRSKHGSPDSLRPDGPLAELAVKHARAYL
nr:maleylpyruvate isomerase family mycothiol-dependent enzyme [Kibdelosporangium phytohabitans]